MEPNNGEQALLNLMQDITCLDQLRPWTERINIFHVLKIARTEIRHSNMLAWLLDPNENHGLGSYFLQAFITDLSKSHSYEFSSEDFDSDAIIPTKAAIDLLSSDLTNTQVFREWNHIDVLIKLPKGYVIAIENKVDAAEGKRNGKSQLENYSEALHKNNLDTDKIIKVFLTPNGDKPSKENQDWKVYTYFDILTILNHVYESFHNNLSVEARILINNYIGILNNEIMDGSELKNLCNEIYQKHKQAFDLIFENRDSVTSMASLICFNKLNELKHDNPSIELLSDKPGVNIKFTTDGSRSIKDRLKSIEMYYVYEFRPSGDYGVIAKLVLVLHNLNKDYDEENANTINKYAEKNKCKENKVWEWKGIWGETTSFKEINDDDISKWIEESYNKIKRFEKKKELDREHS